MYQSRHFKANSSRWIVVIPVILLKEEHGLTFRLVNVLAEIVDSVLALLDRILERCELFSCLCFVSKQAVLDIHVDSDLPLVQLETAKCVYEWAPDCVVIDVAPPVTHHLVVPLG